MRTPRACARSSTSSITRSSSSSGGRPSECERSFGPDEDHREPLDVEDSVELLDGLRPTRSARDQRVLEGLRDHASRSRPYREARPGPAPRIAARWIQRGGDDGLRLRRRVHTRDDHARPRRHPARTASRSRCRRSGERAQGVPPRSAPAMIVRASAGRERAVLRVRDEHVEPAGREHLARRDLGRSDEAADEELAAPRRPATHLRISGRSSVRTRIELGRGGARVAELLDDQVTPAVAETRSDSRQIWPGTTTKRAGAERTHS